MVSFGYSQDEGFHNSLGEMNEVLETVPTSLIWIRTLHHLQDVFVGIMVYYLVQQFSQLLGAGSSRG